MAQNPRTSQELGRWEKRWSLVQLLLTEASLRTQVKSVSALVHSQSRPCGLFKELSVNKSLRGPNSIQVIPHMLSRSEISTLRVIWENTKVTWNNTCSRRNSLENLEQTFAVPFRKLSKNEGLWAWGILPIPEHFYSSSKGWATVFPERARKIESSSLLWHP